MNKVENIKILYPFSTTIEKEVEEITTREEDGKTITEKIKVKKSVPVYFTIKKPSRAEREIAEEERAIWWSHYVDKGLKTQALLAKLYLNNGGTLSDAQKKDYIESRALLLGKMEEYELLKITAKDNKEELNKVRLELVYLRDKIVKFEQDQAEFFENTAESKARIKLGEWLITNLSYWRDSEDKEWIPYFNGKTQQEKMKIMESLEEDNDELYNLVQPQLYFLVSFLISSNFSAVKADIDNYLNEPE